MAKNKKDGIIGLVEDDTIRHPDYLRLGKVDLADIIYCDENLDAEDKSKPGVRATWMYEWDEGSETGYYRCSVGRRGPWSSGITITYLVDEQIAILNHDVRLHITSKQELKRLREQLLGAVKIEEKAREEQERKQKRKLRH